MKRKRVLEGVLVLALPFSALASADDRTAGARRAIAPAVPESAGAPDSSLSIKPTRGEPARLHARSPSVAEPIGGGSIDSASLVEGASLRFDLSLALSGQTGAPGEEPDLEQTLDGPDAGSTDSLANKLQNPISDLISVPFQFNWDTGIGEDGDSDRLVVNIQPVIPISLNEDWNLISRTILPVVYAEGPAEGISSEFGIGDVTQSLFFSPVEPVGGNWILGFGPVAGIPTGTDDLFRSKQLSLGPTFVGLRQDHIGEGTLTWGLLANHLWKVAGSDSRPDVNSTFLQPFLAYTLKTGTTFSLITETTYDWTSEEWSVPINAGISQLVTFGEQPVQFQLAGRWYADTVPNGPEWGLRFTITLLFPK